MNERQPATPPTSTLGNGLMIGAVFAVLILAGAWISGVFTPSAAPHAAAPGQAAPGSGASPDTAAALAASSPPVRAAPVAAAPLDAPPVARSAVWRDVSARTPSGATGPLVIGLHGRGDRIDHFAGLAPRFPGQLSWRFLQGRVPFGRGFAWFSRDAGGRPQGIAASVAAIHRQVLAAGAGRPVGLFGFSQGCMMIIHYVVAHPDQIKAAVCVGGSVVGPLATEPGGATRPPILFVNGVGDLVVPAQATRHAMQRLEALGYPTEQIEHPGGHTVPAAEINRMGTWLLTKLRRP